MSLFKSVEINQAYKTGEFDNPVNLRDVIDRFIAEYKDIDTKSNGDYTKLYNSVGVALSVVYDDKTKHEKQLSASKIINSVAEPLHGNDWYEGSPKFYTAELREETIKTFEDFFGEQLVSLLNKKEIKEDIHDESQVVILFIMASPKPLPRKLEKQWFAFSTSYVYGDYQHFMDHCLPEPKGKIKC